MEKELNIAEILKEKPLGIKLWTDAFGEVTLDYVSKNGNGFNVKHHHGVLDKFLSNGKIYEEGTLCIYPSRNMRDWRKFAWKKGDVLVSNGEHIIFEKWKNNSYTTFLGLFDSIDNNSLICLTSVWEKETNEVQINKYISQIEKAGGGKLNLSTLEIEKPQFKDGDIVFVEGTENYCDYIEIFSHFEDGDICDHASYDIEKSKLDCDGYYNIGKDEYQNIRPATDSEKQQLFDALANVNKAWDAEKKAIVNLPKKCELKPKDWCLMKYKGHYNNRGWELCQYAYTEHRVSSCGESRDFYHSVGGAIYAECIPYTDQTAHLLGTNDDWKGGEE